MIVVVVVQVVNRESVGEESRSIWGRTTLSQSNRERGKELSPCLSKVDVPEQSLVLRPLG